MDVEVRPCASTEELADALSVIGQYFGLEAQHRERRAVPELDRARPHARRLGRRPDRRRRRCVHASTSRCRAAIAFRAPESTVIGVQPTDRRRGVMTAMMRAQLDDIHRRGEPLAYLWASEGTIYGRFGYGLASQQASIALPKERTAFAQPFEPRGRVRFVTAAEALELFPPLYERVRDIRPGMFSRSRAWWETRRLADDPSRRRAGPGAAPPGAPRARRRARRLRDVPHRAGHRQRHHDRQGDRPRGDRPDARRQSASSGASCSTSTGSRAIECDYLPTDSALVLLLAEPRHLKQTLSDARLGQARRRGGGARARVPWPTARRSSWKSRMPSARGTPAAGTSRRATSGAPTTSADLRLDVSALGSVYLGGFTFGDLVRAVRATELRPGAAPAPTRCSDLRRGPWCPEIF